MQALQFSAKGLNVFWDYKVWRTTLAHFAAIIDFGNVLNARKLVFGLPKHRDRSGLNDQEAFSVAVDIFGSIGDLAHKYRVTLLNASVSI